VSVLAELKVYWFSNTKAAVVGGRTECMAWMWPDTLSSYMKNMASSTAVHNSGLAVENLDQVSDSQLNLTLILLTWRIGRAPNYASNWQMGFNSAFKGLICFERYRVCETSCIRL